MKLRCILVTALLSLGLAQAETDIGDWTKTEPVGEPLFVLATQSILQENLSRFEFYVPFDDSVSNAVFRLLSRLAQLNSQDCLVPHSGHESEVYGFPGDVLTEHLGEVEYRFMNDDPISVADAFGMMTLLISSKPDLTMLDCGNVHIMARTR